MKTIALTTPLGTVGRETTARLAGAQHSVRGLVRSKGKETCPENGRFEVVEGDLGDQSCLAALFSGADAALLVAPSFFTAPDYSQYVINLSRAYAAALNAANVPNAVFLSSAGSGSDERRGFIYTHALAEHELETHYRGTLKIVRATNFLTNLRYFYRPDKEAFLSPLQIDRPLSWITPVDLADTLTEALLDPAGAEDTVDVRSGWLASVKKLNEIIPNDRGSRQLIQVSVEQFEAGLLASGASQSFTANMGDTWRYWNDRADNDEKVVPSDQPLEQCIEQTFPEWRAPT